MKNIKRYLKIIISGRYSTYCARRNNRYFALLNKSKSIFDPVYSPNELAYIMDHKVLSYKK